jgi:hypothetical protein
MDSYTNYKLNNLSFVEHIAWWWLCEKPKHVTKLHFNPNKCIMTWLSVSQLFGKFVVIMVKKKKKPHTHTHMYIDRDKTTGCTPWKL